MLYAAWANVFILTIATAFAYVAIGKARETENKKATIGFLKRYSDGHLTKARSVLGDNKQPAYGKLTPAEKDFLTYLYNLYEELAVGLDHKIYDRKMIESYLGSEIRKDWEQSKPYIEEARNKLDDPDAWIEFEKLAETLKKAHIKKAWWRFG